MHSPPGLWLYDSREFLWRKVFCQTECSVNPNIFSLNKLFKQWLSFFNPNLLFSTDSFFSTKVVFEPYIKLHTQNTYLTHYSIWYNTRMNKATIHGKEGFCQTECSVYPNIFFFNKLFQHWLSFFNPNLLFSTDVLFSTKIVFEPYINY